MGLKSHSQTKHDNASEDQACNFCNKIFMTEVLLRRHTNQYHGRVDDRKCKYCKEIFSSKSNAAKHTRTKHTKTDILKFGDHNFMIVHDERTNTQEANLVPCIPCERNFSTKADLDTHK